MKKEKKGKENMKREEIIKALESIKNGSYVRVGYKTEMPMKAEFKKEGYKLEKITETTARMGVEYENIGTVKERREKGVAKSTKENHYTWVVPNKLAKNESTGKEYLRITTTKNSNTKKKIVLIAPDGKASSCDTGYEKYVIPSYLKPKPMSEVRNINIDNILKIGNAGQEIVV